MFELNELLVNLRYAEEKHHTPVPWHALCGRAADAIEELQAQVPAWISVEERLPEESEYVLILVGNIHSGRSIQVARIEKGISKKERALMKEGKLPDPVEYGWTISGGRFGKKRSDCIRGCDEDGNNTVPYKWYANGGPMSWFGQEVTHWMPLPKAPEVEE